MTTAVLEPTSPPPPSGDPQLLVAFNTVVNRISAEFGTSWQLAPAGIMQEAGGPTIEVRVSRARYDAAVEFCSELASQVKREYGYRFPVLVLIEGDCQSALHEPLEDIATYV